MPALVRAAALTNYFPVARHFGLDTTRLLRQVGLPRSLLANPEQMIPAPAVVTLLEQSAAAANCPTFALQMAESRNLADLGVVSLLIAHQPTLRAALDVISQYRNRINSMLMLQIEEVEDTAILREELTLDGKEPARQATDLAIGVLSRICSTVLGPHWQPETMCFSYDEPAAPYREVYRRLFRCRIEFNADINGIVLKSSDLDKPNPRADAALASHARSLVSAIVDTGERTLNQEVEQTILLLLPTGRATIGASAEALGMNLRTLQRHLDLAGSSYSDLLQRTRCQLVGRYMANPKLRLTDISELLGYSSLGSFTRWYSTEFAETPSETRRKMRGR
ncbi:AraC family transcriptional regulator [Sphingomonas sp. LaA6.9]|uniref:AraC family transcriptional regulator n=1 Tax=Sphingomonas sp. LaA6.9 TaxID=2919914 RepID=UPI001F4FC1D0|nr:AraC family transcriptional regulator [Sphingomonas sp. LaA6.9]MCJ8157771.1 AraC family transcriptional regulator [Sphingomonas sp. LaA6.9]